MNCPRCGTKLGSGVTFCFNCNADLRQPVAPAPKPRAGAQEPVAPAVVDTDVVYGTPVARLCAAILAGIVIGIVYAIITTVLTAPLGGAPGTETARALVQLAALPIYWLYFAGFEAARGATPGKKTVGLRVTDLEGAPISFGRATARYFMKIPGTLLVGIGLLMIAFTKRRQGLHDLVARTLVIEADPQPQGAAESSAFPLSKTVIWLLNILATPITGAILYYAWRRDHRQAAKYANQASLISFVLWVTVAVAVAFVPRGPVSSEDTIRLSSSQFYRLTLREARGTTYELEASAPEAAILLGCVTGAALPAQIVLTATGIQDVANSKRIAGRELGRVTGPVTGARLECVIANPNPSDVNVRFKLAVR
jgi:uncharacterized RDD family membrane protein YckC